MAAFFLPHPEVPPILERSGRKRMGGVERRGLPSPFQRSHLTQGPHCVLGNSSLAVRRWLALFKGSGRSCSGDRSQRRGEAGRGGEDRWQERSARALGPRGRPGPRTPASRGRRAPGGGAWLLNQPARPPPAGGEAPTPRPPAALRTRAGAGGRPARSPADPPAMEHIRTPKVGARRGPRSLSQSWAAGGMLSVRAARPPCGALGEPAPRAGEEEAAPSISRFAVRLILLWLPHRPSLGCCWL